MVKKRVVKAVKIRTLKPNEADENTVYYDLKNSMLIKPKLSSESGGYWYWAKWDTEDLDEYARNEQDAENIYTKPDDNDPNRKEIVEAKDKKELLTKIDIQKLSQSIEDYKEGLENEQDRDYGDLNINIKLHGMNVPVDEIKELYPKVTDDTIDELYWQESNDYVGAEVERIKDKYGWEAGTDGRSGGWFYVNGIMHDLQMLIDELFNLESYDEMDKIVLKEYNQIEKKFKDIQTAVTDIENSVKEMIKNFEDSVESIDTWKNMPQLKSKVESKKIKAFDFTINQDLDIGSTVKSGHFAGKIVKVTRVQDVYADEEEFNNVTDYGNEELSWDGNEIMTVHIELPSGSQIEKFVYEVDKIERLPAVGETWVSELDFEPASLKKVKIKEINDSDRVIFTDEIGDEGQETIGRFVEEYNYKSDTDLTGMPPQKAQAWGADKIKAEDGIEEMKEKILNEIKMETEYISVLQERIKKIDEQICKIGNTWINKRQKEESKEWEKGIYEEDIEKRKENINRWEEELKRWETF